MVLPGVQAQEFNDAGFGYASADGAQPAGGQPGPNRSDADAEQLPQIVQRIAFPEAHAQAELFYLALDGGVRAIQFQRERFESGAPGKIFEGLQLFGGPRAAGGKRKSQLNGASQNRVAGKTGPPLKMSQIGREVGPGVRALVGAPQDVIQLRRPDEFAGGSPRMTALCVSEIVWLNYP